MAAVAAQPGADRRVLGVPDSHRGGSSPTGARSTAAPRCSLRTAPPTPSPTRGAPPMGVGIAELRERGGRRDVCRDPGGGHAMLGPISPPGRVRRSVLSTTCCAMFGNRDGAPTAEQPRNPPKRTLVRTALTRRTNGRAGPHTSDGHHRNGVSSRFRRDRRREIEDAHGPSGAFVGNFMVEWYDFGIHGYLAITMKEVFLKEFGENRV